MAKVLLVNTPFYRLLGSHYNANSLGIAYIAAVLNRRGHDAWLYNADFVNREVYANLKGLFENFVDYKSYFKNEDHEIWQEVTEKILDFSPDWVGETSETANLSAIDIVSRKVRRRNPGIQQVVGGVHATLDANTLNHLPAVDFAIRREGEFALAALVEGQKPEDISGVGWRSKLGHRANGETDLIQNIDELPFPERDKFWSLTEDDRRTVCGGGGISVCFKLREFA